MAELTWDGMCTWLASLPDEDPRKHELLAHIYMTLARAVRLVVDQPASRTRRRSGRQGARPAGAYQDVKGRESVTEGL